MTEQKSHRNEFIVLALIAAVTAFVLYLEGRIWIASDGSVYPWVSDAWSDQNSQHLSDPYSFSHLLHGVLFFGMLWPLRDKLNWWWRMNISVALEAAWEILENSPMIIDRYREAGALGYSGDTILNSMGDLACCGLGFWVAHKLGLKKSIILFVVVEVVLILTIRDSLIINVIMLIHPVEAIKEWQSVVSGG
ncbi:MAG: DUF2585 family protein [Planctomycetota bacterium]|nr:DUF2585 family protein [Planctomycetota bacterium]